jgi:ABC-type transport system substrate-binding protein
MDHALWDERTKANEFDAFYGGGTWGLLEGTYLSGTGLPHWTTTHLSFHALQWNLWKDSDGAMGEQPPPAMLDAYAAYEAAKTSFDAAEQERYMKEVLDIAADNLWTVGLLTKFGRVMVFNAKLANAPTVNRNWWRGDKGRPELYYWRE